MKSSLAINPMSSIQNAFLYRQNGECSGEVHFNLTFFDVRSNETPISVFDVERYTVFPYLSVDEGETHDPTSH